MHLLIRLFAVIPFLLLLKACAMPPDPGYESQQPYYPLPEELTAGDIFHLPTGYQVTHDAVIDHARRAQVVYVGEIHDNLSAHHLQVDILKSLTATNPGKVTVAMEMFTPSQQSVLDRWSAGELSEKEFLKQVDWYATWGVDFDLYRDLLLTCRDQGIKILAVNAERPVREALSRTPIEELPDQLRQRLPEMNFSDPHYHAMVTAFAAGHPMGQFESDGFLRVQTLWDETMAANLADYLLSQGEDHQVMVVAGNNHIQYGFGIPRRLFRRLPVSYLLIGTTETAVSAHSDPDRVMNINSPEHPLLPYHFLYITDYEPLPRSGVRLGVVITSDSESGVLIEKVLPGSVAAQEGFQPGDRLLSLDQEPLEDTFDLIHALRQKQIGSTAALLLLREQKEITVMIEFTAENQQHE